MKMGAIGEEHDEAARRIAEVTPQSLLQKTSIDTYQDSVTAEALAIVVDGDPARDANVGLKMRREVVLVRADRGRRQRNLMLKWTTTGVAQQMKALLHRILHTQLSRQCQPAEMMST